MPKISYVNGRYLPHREAAVHIEDRGYQFADGVYEYVAFYNRRLLDGDLHFNRLERSLRELHIAPPVSPAALPVIVREMIERNGREDGGLYIQVTRGVAPRNHAFPAQPKSSLVMTIGPAKLPKEKEVKEGVAVITCPDQRWARRDIKSIALLPNILARQEAGRKSAREAWLIEGEHISEGSSSNAYIVTEAGELVTHPTNEHILGGITRDVVLRLAKKNGIAVAERAFAVAEMKAAAEAFTTSTSINVLPVTSIDGRKVGNGRVGLVTRKLQELYAAHVEKQTGKVL